MRGGERCNIKIEGTRFTEGTRFIEGTRYIEGTRFTEGTRFIEGTRYTAGRKVIETFESGIQREQVMMSCMTSL